MRSLYLIYWLINEWYQDLPAYGSSGAIKEGYSYASFLLMQFFPVLDFLSGWARSQCMEEGFSSLSVVQTFVCYLWPVLLTSQAFAPISNLSYMFWKADLELTKIERSCWTRNVSITSVVSPISFTTFFSVLHGCCMHLVLLFAEISRTHLKAS